MKNIKSVLTILFAIITLATNFAQNNPYAESDRYGDNKQRNGSRRFTRQCTEPFPARSFNRDYAGMSTTNFYHIDKELRDYTKSRCLTSEQIRRLTLFLPTDREKYDYLTFSLNYVFDIENFAMAGAVLSNRNARDGFYKFLVREGVPAGDYYADPYYAANGAYCAPPPPQYDRYGNGYGNRNDNRNAPANNDPYYSNNNNGNNNNNRDYYGNQNNNPNSNQYNQGQAGINSGYRGLMTYQEFEILKEKIKQNTFEKGKLDAAKLLTKENVLTTNQISEITRMFNFDNNRLEYAKFAYEYVYDRENYTAVGDAMSFENSRKDLQRYVESRRKG